MSVPEQPVVPDASTVQAKIVAAVSARSDGDLSAVLDAVRRQVYEPHTVVVVGGGDAARATAKERVIRWVADLRTLLDELDRAVTHVWMLHDDARPRPDALKSLPTEAVRVDASVAGSKLLDSTRPEVLESVGGATDVFGMPYTGLEDEEVDQEQYDVVRDVAFIPGASVLVRRDILRGLGGPDALLPPFEAGIDFSQRARAAGGRVVVVPSSEVLHEPLCGGDEPRWKSRAGRIRAALKVYSLLTLTWLIPVGAMVDLLDGVVRLAIGPRMTILDVFRAWAWNAANLRSTVAARAVAGRARQVGDAELFRYQVRGSSILRRLGDDITDAVRGPTVVEGTSTITDLLARGRQFWQQPGVVIGAMGFVLVALAGRSIILGRLPATGYALHLPESAIDTLRAYAGGWNPAELGNPRPFHPSVGAVGLVQLIAMGRAGLAEMALTVGGAVAAFIGTSRLVRMLGLGSAGRFMAGVVAVGGPATLAMTEAGLWSGIPALAVMPFALGSFLRPWPRAWRGRLGRIALDALPVAILAAFTPLAVAIPLVATILWFVFGIDRHWSSVARALVATIVALPILAPWIVFIDPDFLLEAGRGLFWNPPAWVVAVFALAVVVPLLLGTSRTAAVVGWGGLLAGIGAAVARTSELGSGVEPATAGLVTAAVGVAIVAGAAVDSLRRSGASSIWRRVALIPGVLGGVALAVSVVASIADGALGLGEDQFAEPFEFTTARQADHGPDRVLVIGPPEKLPGDARVIGEDSYRLFQAPEPTLLEAYLHPSLEGDWDLNHTLGGLAGEDSLRPGEQLALFGIRWIVFTDPSPLEAAFASKLDVKPLPLTEFEAVYENLVASPVAAEVGGDPWARTSSGYAGRRSDGRVRIAENADGGWGPAPASAEWAVTISAEGGEASYRPNGAKAAYAWSAAGLLVLLVAAALFGRKAMQ